MTPDVAEMAELLHGGKLLLVFLMQGEVQPAGADAVIGEIVEGSGVPGTDGDFLAHMFPPFSEG